MFREQLEALGALGSLKDLRTVVGAIIEYGMNGNEDVEIPEHLQFGWAMMKSKIDAVLSHNEEIENKRKDAATSRWHKDTNNTTGCKSMQTDAKACKSMQTDAKGSIPYPYPYPYPQDGTLNKPQSASEVVEQAAKMGCSITEEQSRDFIGYYESTADSGLWKVRGEMVRDWRKLLNRKWCDNWRNENSKKRKLKIENLKDGRGLSHDPKDFGEADEI